MLYALEKFWSAFALRGWFRQIEVHFDSKIPQDKPVLFACNHPNSAVDFMLVNHVVKKDLHVLVRGDVFKKSFLNAIFRSMKMIPVYRMQDGFHTLRGNNSSFQECFDLFNKNGHVLIFSEGLCLREKHLRPLKKGTARLALDYVDRPSSKELLIVPVGINYTYHAAFRKRAMVQFGEPFPAIRFLETYRNNKAEGLKQLTGLLQAKLQEKVIDLGRDENVIRALKYQLRLKRLYDKMGTFPLVRKSQTYFQQEKKISEQRDFPDPGPEKIRQLARFEGVFASRLSAMVPAMLFTPFLILAALWVAIPVLLVAAILKFLIRDRIFEATVWVIGTGVFALLGHHIAMVVLLINAEWQAALPWAFFPLVIFPAIASYDAWERVYKSFLKEKAKRLINPSPR